MAADDTAYRADPRAAVDGPITTLVEDMTPALRLFGPARMDLGEHQSLPLVAAWVDSLRVLASADLEQYAVVVAGREDDGRVYAAPAFEYDPTLAAPPADPAEVPEGAFAASSGVFDLLERVDLPPRPTRLSAWLLVSARISPPITIELVEPDGRYADAAVEGFLRERWARMSPQGVHPPAGTRYPSYRDDRRAPALPSQPGIVLATTGTLHTETGQLRAVLRGSYRLPLRPRERRPAAGEAAPRAIVPITLVVTGDAAVGPGVLAMQVPSYRLDEQGAQPQATGSFALDLAAHGLIPEALMDAAGGPLHVYGFSGTLASAPVTLATRTPEPPSWE